VALEAFNNQSGLTQTLALNIRWAQRGRHIAWREVEPSEGFYNWAVLANLESELLTAQANQIEPIIVIKFTPEWAQLFVPYTCGPIRSDKFEAFAKFMEQLVIRYGSSSPYGLRYWQLGNELDLAPEEVGPETVFGCWGDANDAYYGVDMPKC
jgi:hypothetical protein